MTGLFEPIVLDLFILDLLAFSLLAVFFIVFIIGDLVYRRFFEDDESVEEDTEE